MIYPKDFQLSENDKEGLEEKAKKITEEDVIKVKTKFGGKLEKLKSAIKESKYTPGFIANLIENVQLLYKMLCDSEYSISGSTKRWIVFALFYLISPVDVIPDWIPVIGYLDDALVILWVMDRLDDEITRYKAYLKAKSAKNRGGHIINLIKRSTTSEIVIVTGFYSGPWKVDAFDIWLKDISRIDRRSSISVFVWDTKEFTSFLCKTIKLNTLTLMRNPKQLLLNLGYTIDKLINIWKDAKFNASLYADVLVKDIDNLLLKSKTKKNVTLISHSLGARLIYNSLGIMEKNMVKKIYTLGGAANKKGSWTRYLSKMDLLINCYSTNDSILRFLYKIAELGEEPIGLTRIGKTDTKKRIEIDCSKWVNEHTKYAENAIHWFNRKVPGLDL